MCEICKKESEGAFCDSCWDVDVRINQFLREASDEYLSDLRSKIEDQLSKRASTPIGSIRSMISPTFRVRVLNGLNNLGVKTVADCAKLTRRDLIRAKNLGTGSIAEIESVLRRFGLKLRAS